MDSALNRAAQGLERGQPCDIASEADIWGETPAIEKR
jgi:hypothetical protein